MFIVWGFANFFVMVVTVMVLILSNTKKYKKSWIAVYGRNNSTLLVFSFFSSLSVFFIVAVGFFLQSPFISTRTAFMMIKIGFILGGLLFYRYAKKKIFELAAIAIGILCMAVFLFVAYSFVEEFMPHYFGTFPLNDTKGKYIINYDGDYWVTYYTRGQVCRVQCEEEWIKTGNTSVTESPIDLKPYIDMTVTITGDFQKIPSSLSGNDRKLCIGTGLSKSCFVSHGEGVWYYSPLIIKSISKVSTK
jgi:hypothetical protein